MCVYTCMIYIYFVYIYVCIKKFCHHFSEAPSVPFILTAALLSLCFRKCFSLSILLDNTLCTNILCTNGAVPRVLTQQKNGTAPF